MGKQYEQSHTLHNAKSKRGRRHLDERLPKIIESPKTLLALRGHATSAISTAVLVDIHMLKKPFSKKLQRKNEILPFETGGEAHLENLIRLNDCSLFALANHTKKRPHNIILGRTFDFRILDMVEFGITNYAPIQAFPEAKIAPGSVPLILFNGDDFDANSKTQLLRSLLLDIFKGPSDFTSVDLTGVDHVIVFTLEGDSKLNFRHYGIELRKSKESPAVPDVKLIEAGPKFDMTIRRVHEAPEAMRKEALRKPKDPRKDFKQKNVSRDELGDKKGRIHVGRQDLSTLVLARMKGLNKKRGHMTEGENDDGKTVETEEHNDIANDEDSNADGGDDDLKSPSKKPRLDASTV